MIFASISSTACVSLLYRIARSCCTPVNSTNLLCRIEISSGFGIAFMSGLGFSEADEGYWSRVVWFLGWAEEVSRVNLKNFEVLL